MEPLLIGTKAAVMPATLYIELRGQLIYSLTARYHMATSTNEVFRAVNDHMEVPPRHFGGGVFSGYITGWRNERRKATASLFVDEDEKVLTVLLVFIGPVESRESENDPDDPPDPHETSADTSNEKHGTEGTGKQREEPE
jgi:hypothetical protein